jgi:Spy/CpxP family protein refolding chaperone
MKLKTLPLLTALLVTTVALPAQTTTPTTATSQAPDPAKFVERRVERLAEHLSLSAAQQTQAKTILTEEATARQTLQPQLRTAQEALRNAVTTTGLDLDIEKAAAQLEAARTQLTIAEAKSQAKLLAILTPEQKTKMTSREGRRGPGGPGFGGFNGGPGGPRNR